MILGIFFKIISGIRGNGQPLPDTHELLREAFPNVFRMWDTGNPEMVQLLGIKKALGIFGNRKWKTQLANT